MKILDRHSVTRRFRRSNEIHDKEEIRVHACLLEYGESIAKQSEFSTNFSNVKNGDVKSPIKASTASTVGIPAPGAVAGAAAGAPTSVPSGGGIMIGGVLHSIENVQLSHRDAASAVTGSAINSSSNGKSISTATIGDSVMVLPINDSTDILSNFAVTTTNTSELTAFEKKLVQVAKEVAKEEQQYAEQASKDEVMLMEQMSKVREDATQVSGSQLGAIVGLGSSNIGAAQAAYQQQVDEAKKLIEENLSSGKLGQLAALKRQEQSLSKQLEEVESKLEEMKVIYAESQEKLEILDQKQQEVIVHIETAKQKIEKLVIEEKKSSQVQQRDMIELKKYIMLNETLKAQEAAFKQSCKIQLEEFNKKIQLVENLDDENSEEYQRMIELQSMHAKLMAKYNHLRQVLSETNLEVASTSRIIDDVPTRSELIQYERRFVELYQQVAWKLEETRKYYDQYNTLDSSLTFIQKEVKLLNSISENFTEAMKNSDSKTEFLQQFEAIVKGVEESLKKQKSIAALKSTKVDELKAIHQNLVDEQRKYFKAIKDFQEECNKNEWLTSKLEQLKLQRH